MRIAVYCGAAKGTERFDYMAEAQALGKLLAENNIELVYGGATSGLMGAVADSTLAAGGTVIGVMPHLLAKKEQAHKGLTKLFLVNDMHERKAKMADLADAFIAMPGGYGTLEEISEVLCWAQLGLHAKPCAFYNINGFYDHLLAFIQHAKQEQFLADKHHNMLIAEDNVQDILTAFNNYQAPPERWVVDRQALKPKAI